MHDGDVKVEETSLHRLDMLLGDSNRAMVQRRRYLEERYGIELRNIGNTIIDFNGVVGRNIENPIGAVQVPLGVAGPLKIRGENAVGDYYIPLATTEGALVASVNRGCKVVSESGGAYSIVYRNAMTRAPIFRLPSAKRAMDFVRWVKEHLDDIRREAESTTRHGRLMGVEPYIVGNNVWLRFSYFTGDAMGMNMATIATDKACNYIMTNFPDAELVALSGNMCVDKKPNAVNYILGRGKSVISEAIIRKDILDKYGVDAWRIHEVNTRKNLLGSAAAHSYGYNAHFANIIAAIFIATGQDAAQVVESSMGITWTEPLEGGDLYISVTLPSLEVGTVGGGTWLPTQREALQLLGVYGPGDPPGTNAIKFAEIVGAAVLAGELNLLLALAKGELARAHERLGRGRSG